MESDNRGRDKRGRDLRYLYLYVSFTHPIQKDYYYYSKYLFPFFHLYTRHLELKHTDRFLYVLRYVTVLGNITASI